MLEKIAFFSQPKKRDIPPSVRNERPIIRGEREREKKNYKDTKDRLFWWRSFESSV